MKQKIELSELDPQHWRPSPVSPDKYMVSDNGQVYSLVSRKMLRSFASKGGYLQYALYKGKKRKIVLAHRLVAIAFIENPGNKPEVDHINTNRTDNRAANLRWVTKKENQNNPLSLKKHLGNKYAKKRVAVYKDGVLISEFETQLEAANFVGLKKCTISYHLLSKGKSHKGYMFKRVEV